MNLPPCKVSVKQLPASTDSKQRREFLRELESCLNAGRPCIVIDCAKVHEIDRGTLLLLLCCLEEAMKRQGDVRLASIPRQAQVLLKATGIGRLFRIFDHVADAVSSYRHGNTPVLESALGGGYEMSADAA
jgi:anti-anti-sigma regulatory factor